MNQTISPSKFSIFSVSNWLLLFYVVVLPIQSGTKIQLSEFIFLLFFLTVSIGAFSSYRKLKSFNFQKLDYGVFVLFAGYLPSFFYQLYLNGINGSLISVIEVAGVIYLSVLYFSIRIFAFLTNEETVIQTLKRGFFICGCIASISILVGSFNSIVLGNHRWVQHYGNFPYLGDVVRATGMMVSPNMIMSLLVTAVVINFQKIKGNLLLTIFFVTAMVLTVSKSWLIFLGGVLFFYPFKNNYFKWSSKVVAIAFCCAYLFLTHLFIDTDFDLSEDVLTENYIGSQAIFEVKAVKVFPTTYASLKNAALIIGNKNFPFGVGPGNFNKGLMILKEKGVYSADLPSYDPHSSFTGSYAELGVFGFISFLIFIFLIYSTIKKLPLLHDEWLLYALFIFFLMETISTDIVNFRHYWLSFALLISLSLFGKDVRITSKK